MSQDNDGFPRWLIALLLLIAGVFVTYALVSLSVVLGSDDPNVNIGTFGDSFGLFSALFSGSAFVAVLWTLHIQRIEFREHREQYKSMAVSQVTALQLERDRAAMIYSLRAENSGDGFYTYYLELLPDSPVGRAFVGRVLDNDFSEAPAWQANLLMPNHGVNVLPGERVKFSLPVEMFAERTPQDEDTTSFRVELEYTTFLGERRLIMFIIIAAVADGPVALEETSGKMVRLGRNNAIFRPSNVRLQVESIPDPGEYVSPSFLTDL
jgi:hypothetical protein